MKTNLEIVVIEDSLLTNKDFADAAAAADKQLQLTAQGFTLSWADFSQITSRDILEKVCKSIGQKTLCARIIISDLDLTAAGLTPEGALDCYNSWKNDRLPTLQEKDKSLAGGFLAVMKALESDSPQQLVCVATNRANEDLVEEQIGLYRSELGKWGKYERLRGGLDSSIRRTQYLVSAIKAWLSAFGNPRARLWPDSLRDWFSEMHPTVPHNYSEINDIERYQKAIAGYLSRAIFMPEDNVLAMWKNLATSHKENFHNYLKGFVGAHASAHIGNGYHLRWNHLPLLAAASAAAPGKWIFDATLLSAGNLDILPPCHHHSEQAMIDHLVGAAAAALPGVFPALFADESTPKQSNLGNCSVTDNSFTAGLIFDISAKTAGRDSLFYKFKRAIEIRTEPGGSSGNALFAAWKFFESVNLTLSLNQANNSLEIRTR